MGGSDTGGSGGDGCTPVDDDNECTDDVCEDGAPHHEPRATGTACSIGVCDGDGACVPEACENGEIDGDETDVDCGGEECSPCGNGDDCDIGADCKSGVCDVTCQAPSCGDGVTQSPEVCDDGDEVEGDGCDTNCTVSECGNGVADPTEECDDGDSMNGDDCDNNCTLPACGNGEVAPGEDCDDGNSTDGDGCDNNCTETACGNGIITAGEECDDDGVAASDGCDSGCSIDADYECAGVPSDCEPTTSGETFCNDGLDNDGDDDIDAADSDCVLPDYFLGCDPGEVLRVFRSTDVPASIVNGAPDTSNIVVTRGGNVERAAVLLDITHTNLIEVVVDLDSPGADPLNLTSNNGASLDFYTATLFDSACATSVIGSASPFTGCYSPEASLSALAGTASVGTWTLNLSDTAAGDSGSLTAWTLVLCTAP